MSVVIDGTTGITVPEGASQAQAEAGTDNTVLMTPLRTAQAIAALAPAPTLDYELISTSTISSPVATVDFTGFDDSVYGSYAFTLHSVIPVTDAVELFMRFSTDGGSTFITTNTYRYSTSSQQTNTVTNNSSNGTSGLILAGASVDKVGSAANEFGVSGQIRLLTPYGAARTSITSSVIYHTDNGGIVVMASCTGENTTTSAVNAVRFYFTSGNVESGRISMYGIRRV